MRRHESGHSLLELLTVIAILGLMLCVAVPAFGTYRRKNSIRVAAQSLQTTLRFVRSRAIARSTNAGMKFTGSGSNWMFAIHDDGDNDGVRNDDIRSGVDPMTGIPAPLMPQLQCARIGLLPYPIKDPDGDPLPPTKSPVQFGTADICSFSPIGSGTPGSIYVTTDVGDLYCIRVVGSSGRVRILRYGANKKWEETR